MKNIDVKGKIVLCVGGGTLGQSVKDAGGAAIIAANDESGGYTIAARQYVLPAAHVSFTAGQSIKDYIKSTPTPTATVSFQGTRIGTITAPTVASFSSRGPSLASPGILKPDIIGPGLSILAASYKPIDNATATTNANFNMVSGTSISCPHLAAWRP